MFLLSKKIIVISGPVASGKSELAERLEKSFDAFVVKTCDELINLYPGAPNDQLSLQKTSDRLDRQTNGKWVRNLLSKAMREKEQPIFIVDSVRTKKQISEIRKSFGPIVHLHLTAPREELQKKNNQMPTYDAVCRTKTEKTIESLSRDADVVIDTRRSRKDDVLVRAASRISLHDKNKTGYVDVIIGGQFGSEGKGQIAAYLSQEYDLLVRVGGPNAGYKVPEVPTSYTHNQLPSGTRRGDAKILLGPGMVINVKKLQKEISECNVDHERLSIDPNAMIIKESDIRNEKRTIVKTIGSTGQGVGYATSRKILRCNNVKLE